MKARLVPVNVNYRYREDELHYLFDNADATAVVYEASFAPLGRGAARVACRACASGSSSTTAAPGNAFALPYEPLAPDPDAASRSSAAPTTCCCSTPAAPRACRRA